MDGDKGFLAILGFLVLMGLLTTFTDFSIGPIFEINNATSTPSSQNEGNKKSIVKNSPPEPPRFDVRISSVAQTNNMTTRDEELREDRDPDFRGDEESEYVILEASSKNTGGVNVTNWTLENKFGTEEITIGRARTTIAPNRTTLGEIILNPGDKLYVMSGEAPGDWFSARINICHGYFNYALDDKPSLSLPNQCPRINKDAIPQNLVTEQYCLHEIEEQRVCKPANLKVVSSLVSDACYNYIRSLYTYKTCVEQNYTSENFQTNQWRYYLDLEDPIWDIRNDGLLLKNEQGAIVDIEGDF